MLRLDLTDIADESLAVDIEQHRRGPEFSTSGLPTISEFIASWLDKWR
jgi:hypothetical protein